MSASSLRRQLARMKDEIRAAEERAVRTMPPRWVPLADNFQQQKAYINSADHLFFGGMAGGGKSALLIGLALTTHRKSLILRREATQLKDLKEFLRSCLRNGDRAPNKGDGMLATTAEGRSVELSGCVNLDTAVKRWKGREHDLKGWDEASDFPEGVFRFVNGWCRTTIPGQRTRVVAASNPPTTNEGEWVVQYWGPWLDPRADQKLAPGELGWFIRDPDTDKDRMVDGPSALTIGSHKPIKPHSRTFIPGVMVTALEESGYRAALQSMPEELRNAYLHGNFQAAKKDNDWQLIRTDWVLAAVDRGRRQAWRGQKHTSLPYPAPSFQILTCLGVDPAGGGVDETAMAPVYGRDVGWVHTFRGKETADGMMLARKVVDYTGTNPEAVVRIDTTGGYGLECSNILSSNPAFARTVDPVSFGAATAYRDRSGRFTFQDIRSAMWWHCREMLDPEGKRDDELVTLPDDPMLVMDLTAPRWRLMHGGRIQVEPKQSRQGVAVAGRSQWGTRDRLGRSTDRGDAVVMALWKGEDVLIGYFPRSKK